MANAEPMGGLDQFAGMIGGKEEFISACRLSDVPGVQRVVAIWERHPSETRDGVSLERICSEVGIKPDVVVGAAVSALYKWNKVWGAIKNARALPEIIDASVAAAKTPDGEGDRKMQLQMAGIMPMNRGQTINIIQGGGNRGDGGQLPDFEEDMETIDVFPEGGERNDD